MKEYIVTGSTGYIGFVLVNELIKKGYTPIKILIRSKKSLDRFSGLDINYAIGDINDVEFLRREISPGAVVFHLAGVIDIATLKSKEIYKTNVDACINLIDVCIEKNIEKFIYTSSVSAIIPAKANMLMSEPIYFDPKKVVGHYAKTKAIATKYILDKSRNGKINAVVTYPSAVIGPYDYNISSLGQVVIDYLNHKLTAYTKGKYNFVDVRDVALGLIRAYEVGRSGEDYLLTGDSLSLFEMFKILNKILNRDKMPIKLPLWFIKLVVPLAEMHYLIRGKVPVFSSTSIKILNQNCNFDNSKAKNELRFLPRSVEESFKDMIEWFIINKSFLIDQTKLRSKNG
jgi:dihydroflavonol-4-reductase